MELVIARNPDAGSRLPYLLRVPLEGGLVFRTAGTWPRTKALFCYPVDVAEWPDDPDVVERGRVRSCERRGAAIDLVLDRPRENRSQLVFTRARGRDAVFWQSPRTRKQARPNVRTPTARAAGITELEIVVDTRERYPYRFATQQASVVREALVVGDYAVVDRGGVDADVGHAAAGPDRSAGSARPLAVVERKSTADLVSSLLDGRMRYALADLASVPRAAVVVEDAYAAIFKLERVRPALVADGLAELQIRWPSIPIVFCGNRKLAEEWTYRYLAAGVAWAADERGLHERLLAARTSPVPETPARIRAWARSVGLPVADRGRIPSEVRRAWERAHGR